MKAKYLALPIVALLGILILIATPITFPVGNSEGLKYSGWVCVYKNDEIVQCKHNIITTLGKNMIKTQLGTGAGNYNITNITVANCTAAQGVGDTELCGGTAGIIWGTCGLTPIDGTYSSAGNGAWNITHQWTSTCNDAIVNATGLYNQTGSSQLFAETTFTSVTLQTNDRLNVTWGIEVG